MKLKFLLAIFAAAIPLAACVLETPIPPAEPTAAAAPTVAPTLPPPGATTLASEPVKRFIDVGGARIAQYSNVPPVTIDPAAPYSAVIRTSLGNMEIELFPAQAPVTVNNFIFLAKDGFYDGVVFHRVIPSFMIQGGDPFGQPGRLAMANSGPATNGSQFFVTTAPTPHLNNAHTIFGQITQGQEVADAISLAQTGPGNVPITPIMILGIEVTKGP